jgi:subtilase family serine protease
LKASASAACTRRRSPTLLRNHRNVPGNRYGAEISNTQFGHLAPCGYQPAELDTAYGMIPLFAAGLDGFGETIVIVDAFGSATIAEDADAFSQIYGLPRISSEKGKDW